MDTEADSPVGSPLDPRVASFLASAAQAPPIYELSPNQARRAFARSAGDVVGPPDPIAAIFNCTIPCPSGQLPLRVYRAHGAGPRSPVFVYFHGGGWVIGDLDTHEVIGRSLAARAGCVAVSVDYRRAPEHRFPAAVEDAWSATEWVAENSDAIAVDPLRIAVGGDSAGGNLAAVVAIRARDRGISLAAQLLVYPVTDSRRDSPSYGRFGDGYGLTRRAMAWYWSHYLGPDGDGDHPEASPLRADDVSGAAPAYVLTAEYDPLRDEGEAYAARLAAAGVPVTLRRFDGVHHGFWRMTALLPQATEALDDAASALRGAFAAVEPR
jgi:acetyl esterase